MHVADAHGRRVHPAKCDGWNLEKLLESARERVHQGPVLIGIDLAIGLPKRFWLELLDSERHEHPKSFVEWLGQQDPDSE